MLESIQDQKHFVEIIQDEICSIIKALDPGAEFLEDLWEYRDEGGGITRIFTNGQVIEKGGVNTSAVAGKLPELAQKKLNLKSPLFSATGISMVLHTQNPHVPAFHANFRYLNSGDQSWFGGGCDLTPYYINHKQFSQYHQELKTICDRHHPNFYDEYKKACDEYFYLPHRSETRGIGGLFFDHLDEKEAIHGSFWKDCAENFFQSWTTIAQANQSIPFTEEQKEWQLHRRSRYAEFNLLYDRGTTFGLQTGGRTESILMSLPPLTRWEYRYEPVAESAEAELLKFLKPIDWV